MANSLNYAEVWLPDLLEIMEQDSLTSPFITSNVKWVGAKTFHFTQMKTSGYKSHNRNGGWNKGSYEQNDVPYTVTHDRDIEFLVDVADVDETNATASLNKLLNGAYYNAQDGTNSGYCYGYSTTATANCDYTKRGIQAGYRGMIASVTWHLGGYLSTSATTSAFYGYERGTTVYSGRPTSTTGYIGLMYPSDYGYSVLSSSCARTTNLGSYNSANCAGQSWLYGKGYEWTLTPYSSYSDSVFILYYSGYLSSFYANYGCGSRPVLYLKASVTYAGGSGTKDSPITLVV